MKLTFVEGKLRTDIGPQLALGNPAEAYLNRLGPDSVRVRGEKGVLEVAKKDKDSIISAAGLFLAFHTDLFRELERMRTTKERAHTALSDPDVIRQFARMIADLGAHRIKIGCDRKDSRLRLTLQNLLESGEYQYVDEEVYRVLLESYMACYLPEELTVVQPGEMLTTEEALQVLDARGYRPASFFELVYAASVDKLLGQEYPVLSLNQSTVIDTRIDRVLMVEPFVDNRQIVLRKSSGTTWAHHTGFLAIRN